ncbi:MAG: exodeoxyribonuclease VII small subunit [bacterium]|nr:exodeoxyribonuclease VII small subunit [bacterium]
MTNTTKKKQTFEQALNELETIVEKLEASELSLDKSLDQFEKGMNLAKHCEEELNKAAGRVETVVDGNSK